MTTENAAQDAAPPTSEPPGLEARVSQLEDLSDSIIEWVDHLEGMVDPAARWSPEARPAMPPKPSKGTP